MSDEMAEYVHLLVTPDFEQTLNGVDPDGKYEFDETEADGVFDALDILDTSPTDIPGKLRLHAMKVERRPWWSITPRLPTGTGIRVMVRPEKRGGVGYWIVGPVTRHYRS